MNYLLTLIAIFIANFLIKAQTTYTSQANGNWLSAATWDNGVPTSGNSEGNENIIIIQPGNDVFIKGSPSCPVNLQKTEVNLTNVVVYVRGKLSMIQDSKNCGLYYNSEGATMNFNGNGSGMFIEEGGMVDGNGGILNSMAQNNNWLVPVWADVLHGDVSGPVTVGSSPNNPLPIELINWSVINKGNQLMALWTTVSENNNHYFSLEESIDGLKFYSIKDIYTDTPNSLELKNYTYNFDAQTRQSTLYYRLKQTDFDGRFSYSDIVTVKIIEDDASLTLYPNPVINHQITIEHHEIEVRDITITSLQFMPINYLRENNTDKKTITIQLPPTVKTGIYVISITTDETVIKKELIIK